MNLKPIKNYEGLYSFDLISNQVWGHKFKKYLKPILKKYVSVTLYKNGKDKRIPLHRLVYEAHKGPIPQGLFIDHIDNNRQNNHINNLRLCNISENQCNRKVQKNNLSTGYKNIYLTNFNTYIVRISKNKKEIYTKTFKTLEEAITNRDIQLKLIHKNFHNLG